MSALLKKKNENEEVGVKENKDNGALLSWEEARMRLKKVLEDYLEEKPADPLVVVGEGGDDKRQKQEEGEGEERGGEVTDGSAITICNKRGFVGGRISSFFNWLLSSWIQHDLDLYLGSFLFSLGLLLLSIFSLTSYNSSFVDDDNNNNNNNNYTLDNIGIYRAQVAAAILLLAGSLLSICMVRRRRFLCVHDSETSKRREVARFLSKLNHDNNSHNKEEDSAEPTGNDNSEEKQQQEKVKDEDLTMPRNMAGRNVSVVFDSSGKIHPRIGNSLTDIYPVYRAQNKADSSGRTCYSQSLSYSWSRIPSLLLVEGDYIALQIGDIAPAKCQMIEKPHYTIQLGDTITLSSVNETAQHLISTLPPGRSTLSINKNSNSSNINNPLTLCNDMRLYRVVEAPLYAFIRHSPGQKRPSQMARKVKEMRKALSLAAMLFFVLTGIIVFARQHDALTRNTNSLLSLFVLPILAAIAEFPVAAPAFMFCIELIGTARILTTVHPYTSRHHAAAYDTNTTTGGGGGTPTSTQHQSQQHQQQTHPASAAADNNNIGEAGSSSSYDGNNNQQQMRLLFRYMLATLLTRLSLWDFARSVHRTFVCMYCHVLLFVCCCCTSNNARVPSFAAQQPTGRSDLVRIPPASLNLLEKLGVATAFALVDDELACEPDAIPQQLLIPAASGLKLLDLCPTYDEDDISGDESGSERHHHNNHHHHHHSSLRGGGGHSFDSDSSEEGTQTTSTPYSTLRRKILRRKRIKRASSGRDSKNRKGGRTNDGNTDDGGSDTDDTDDSTYEVQFEEPTWWQHLPTLKCIGLASLLVDEPNRAPTSNGSKLEPSEDCKSSCRNTTSSTVQQAKLSLVELVCSERRSKQLRALAQCIGFTTEENSFGERGDLSPFQERLRLHVLSSSLFKERIELDSHERSSEQSRWLGLLRPDSSSVIVQDKRSNAYQLLTVGDPAVVTSLCNEAWQGEISTISPLASSAKEMIMETANSWKLGDLDVAAFSYAPVPHTLESRFCGGGGDNGGLASKIYLLDQQPTHSASMSSKEKAVSQEWQLIRNQVFLGVLGSLVIPRREIQKLLSVLNDAGVRFVYFSPRNMRRQKELASQLGIDVAWNCAISLRPLQSGEEDPHRMVSNYADWDVNAKLPHGIEDVRKHLEEVDNVPLLVSLFTDVTKQTTKEMVEIFQEYSDTVIAIGLSHLPRNSRIFASADIAVGIDVLTESSTSTDHHKDKIVSGKVFPSELEFISAISSHSCAFRFRGASSLAHISSIIEQSRAALEAATAAGVFQAAGSLAYSFYVLLSVCVPSTTIPYVPTLGSVLYLLLVLPGIGFAMAMSEAELEAMKQVPPKNDQAVTFARKEGRRLYSMLIFKTVPPALISQLFWLISFGELVIQFEPDLIAVSCGGASSWTSVIRCPALKEYAGPAKTSAGVLSLAQFVLCMLISSASFVYRFTSIRTQKPWQYNHVWVGSVVVVIILTAVYVWIAVEPGTGAALPWYYYLITIIVPFLCLAWDEYLKELDAKQERRSEKLRRLQFETRLGAWSPK